MLKPIVIRAIFKPIFAAKARLAGLWSLKRTDVHRTSSRFSSAARPLKTNKVLTNGFRLTTGLMVCLLVFSVGCRAFREPVAATCAPADGIPNPLMVPMMDRWYVMDQISDEIDNYFRIKREERIRVIDSVMSEGWIETHPQIGGTLVEPWKKDSTPGFEKAHASLQTVRRFAKVRVIPFGNSYQIDVKVFKELEDLIQPLGAAVSGQIMRTDNTLDIDATDPWIGNRSPGWIPMGRDFSLEQKILENLQKRLTKVIE